MLFLVVGPHKQLCEAVSFSLSRPQVLAWAKTCLFKSINLFCGLDSWARFLFIFNENI